MATVTITITINGQDVALTKEDAIRICHELKEALGVSLPLSMPSSTPPWMVPSQTATWLTKDRKAWDLSDTPAKHS